MSDNVKLSIGAYSNCRGSSITEKLETAKNYKGTSKRMKKSLYLIICSMLICSCVSTSDYRPGIIPGIPHGDIREQALRNILYKGITKPDERIMYLTYPYAAEKYSEKTRYLFELLAESAYIEGDLTYYSTLNVAPSFFDTLDKIMNAESICIDDLNKALILSLDLLTNNLSLYLIELGADLNNKDVRKAINEYVEHAYDDSLYRFSDVLKEKVRTYNREMKKEHRHKN